MSNAQLIHIFDNSTCLTKKQMRDYVGGKMTNEEAHAVEVHLNSCPLCSDAVEGLFEQQEGGLTTMHELNTDFLKDHFGLSNPQVHLNSMAATQSVRKHVPREKKPAKTAVLSWRSTSLAAGLLLVIGLLWFYRIDHRAPEPIAKVTDNLSKQPPEVAGRPGEPVAGNVIAMNEPKTGKRSVVQAITQPAPENIAAALDKSADAAPATLAAAADTEPGGVQQEEVMAAKAPPVAEQEPKMAKTETADRMSAATPVVAAASTSSYQPTFGNSYSNSKTEAYQISGARSSKMAYTVDGIRTQEKKSKIAKATTTEPDKLDAADQLYRQKNYGDALNLYAKEMHSNNASRKQTAALGAARCYLAIGNKTQAKKLLQSLADSSDGPVRRHARRLLRDIGE